MFLTSLKSPQSVQDDGTAQPELAGSTGSSATKRKNDAEPDNRRGKQAKMDKSQKSEDGLSYTHNRSGTEICRKFNDGACTLPCPGKRMHQC
eukprot:974502-Amphidinium_carterae.1